MAPQIIISENNKRVLKNFFSLSTLQGISYLLPVLVLPYLVRIIGPEKFGLVAFAQALIQYFMIFTDYGFSLSATKEISINRENKTKVNRIFSSVITVKLFFTLLSLLILLVIINFIPKFKEDWLLYILSFGAVVGNALFPVWLFQGTEKMEYITLINVMGGIIYSLSIFIFIRNADNYLLLPVLNSLFFFCTGISALIVAVNKFKLKFVFQSYSNICNEIKFGWSYFSSILSINAYTTSRVFAVGLLTNNTITGFYSIAEKIAGMIQTFPLTSLSQAIYPRLNKIYSKNKKRAVGLMYMIQDATTSAYFIIIPLIILISPWIVRIICGPRYPEVIIALRLLLFSVFFISANAFKVQFLLICGRQDYYSRIHIFAATLGLPLIFILINYFSFLGAALATIAIEGIIYLLTSQALYFVIKKNFRNIYPKQK